MSAEGEGQGEFIEGLLRSQADNDQIIAAIRDNAEAAERISTELAETLVGTIAFMRSLGLDRSDIQAFICGMAYRADDLQQAIEKLEGGGR